MKAFFAMTVAFLVTAAAPSHSLAQTTNVIYVNGIQNTLEDAAETNEKIRSTLSASQNYTGTARRIFSVTAVWNPIGWNGTADGSDLAQDKMELFLLKTAEEMYGADFRRILAPHNQSRVVDSAAAGRVAAYLDDMTPGSNSLETRGSITDANMARTQTAIQQLIARVQRLQSAVIVAHSQGNLLANLAYARLAATQGSNVYRSVRIVNVANTSEFSVSGLNMTHEGDAALFTAATAAALADQSLQTVPSRGRNWTRTTPSCASNGACNFTLAAATLARPTSNIPNQSVVDETLDHSIVETYLSTATVPVTNEQGVSFSTTATRFVDRFEDFVYAAAYSLSLSQTTGISARLEDEFAAANLDPAIWNSTAGPGGISVNNGLATFGAGSSATTLNKIEFTGSKIVVEARFAGTKATGRDTNISLVEKSTGARIQVGDTNYFGWGLYILGTGAYNLIGANVSRGASTGGINMETNGVTTSAYKYVKYTIDANSIVVQRGDVRGVYTEQLSRTLGTTVAGKTFYVQIGTGGNDGIYSPGVFDWLVVSIP